MFQNNNWTRIPEALPKGLRFKPCPQNNISCPFYAYLSEMLQIHDTTLIYYVDI